MTVSLTGDGSLISFSINPGAFKYLSDGQHVTLTANFDVSDGHGGLTADTAKLTIDGLNDAPVVTGAVTGCDRGRRDQSRSTRWPTPPTSTAAPRCRSSTCPARCRPASAMTPPRTASRSIRPTRPTSIWPHGQQTTVIGDLRRFGRHHHDAGVGVVDRHRHQRRAGGHRRGHRQCDRGRRDQSRSTRWPTPPTSTTAPRCRS